jgi:hypothetical protein
MRKTVLAAIAVVSFLTSEASAVTVINTTQADVKKQCAGKTSCSTACGSTLCNYVCDDPKKQCTAAIYIKRPPSRPRPHGTTGGTYSPR